jgi:hypothetical protein
VGTESSSRGRIVSGVLDTGMCGTCEARRMEPGERMLLWCDGGPSIGRAVAYPPPLEIEVVGGTYVLVDAGAIEHWHYAFVECHGT